MTALEKLEFRVSEMQTDVNQLKIASALFKASDEINDERITKLESFSDEVKKRNTQLGVVIAVLVFFGKWLNPDSVLALFKGH